MSPGPFGLKPQRVGFPRPFYFLTIHQMHLRRPVRKVK
jgi:hypothetical protein